MREDVAYRAIAAGCDDNIARTFQSTLHVIVFGRHIIDLYAGKMQRIDDRAFIVAFGPGRGVVHEKRPHTLITALLLWCSAAGRFSGVGTRGACVRVSTNTASLKVPRPFGGSSSRLRAVVHRSAAACTSVFVLDQGPRIAALGRWVRDALQRTLGRRTLRPTEI